MARGAPGVLHSQNALGPRSQLYGTDPATYRRINREFRFGIDVAAAPWSAKAPLWLGPEHPNPECRDAFAVASWRALCEARHLLARAWLNPPYARDGMKAWLSLVLRHVEDGMTVYMFVPARIETEWYQAAWASVYLHEERRGTSRERFVHPITKDWVRDGKGSPTRAGFPQVGLVFRPGPRPDPEAPRVRYGLAFPDDAGSLPSSALRGPR